MRAAVLALALCGLCGDARADERPRWWQQFYATLGYRAVIGFEPSASSTSVGLGYRVERAAWGIDVAVFDVQLGLAEGLHEIVRATAYLDLHRSRIGRAWIAGGGGYSFVDGWTTTDVPGRSQHGPELVLATGYDLARRHGVAAFTQLTTAVPVLPARDVYRSMDSNVYVVGVSLGVGLRF